MSAPGAYRAGETLEDLCRACKADRLHTVIVVDAKGGPIRVVCGFARASTTIAADSDDEAYA